MQNSNSVNRVTQLYQQRGDKALSYYYTLTDQKCIRSAATLH